MIAAARVLCYDGAMKKFFALLAVWCCAVSAEAVSVLPAETTAETALSAESLPALALLPQNTDSFLACGNADTLPAGWGAAESEVESVAFGATAGCDAALRRLLPLLHLAEAEETDRALSLVWAACAHERSSAVIQRQEAQHRSEDIEQAIAALRDWHLPPLYGVVTLRREAAALAAEWQTALLAELKEDPTAEPLEVGEWKGVRLHAPQNWEEEGLSLLQQVRLRDALEHFSVCVLTAIRERALVVVVCSDPAEAQPAVSPVSSVLQSEKVQFAAEHARPLIMASLSPEMGAPARECLLQTWRSLGGLATGVFKTLAVQDAPAQQSYHAAVAAVATLQEQAERLCPAMTRTSTLLGWADENVHFEWTGSAAGGRFAAKESVTVPENEQTFFLLESDPMEGGTKLEAAAVLQACEQLLDGVAETLSNERRELLQNALMQYRLFGAEQQILGAAFAEWDKAYSGRVALVADACGEVPASLFGGSPVQVLPVPRVALCAGVRSRAEIESGRALLMQAAEQGMQKLGMENELADSLPMAQTQEGAAVLYSLALPMCCPGFSPSVAVADKTWVFGSSAALASQLANAPVAVPAGEGCARFFFRPQPLANLLQKLYADEPVESDEAQVARCMAAFATMVSEISARLTTSADDVMHLQLEIQPAR